MEELQKNYNSVPYEPLVPETVPDPKRFAYKFNSPGHFISWVEHLNEHHVRASDQTSSETGDSRFTLSSSLKDGFNVVRETKFDPRRSDRLQALIRNLKRSTRFSEEGHELSVGEYLAGSDKYWLAETNRRSVSRIINDPVFLTAGYNSHTRASHVKDLGISILEHMYIRRVIPRRMIMCFATSGIIRSGENGYVFIDVSFNDINGVAKVLHPSFFRRLVFRHSEIYPTLSSGYGRSKEYGTDKGVMSIANLYDKVTPDGTDPKLGDHIETFLGIEPKKK